MFKYENNKLCQVEGFDIETLSLKEGKDWFDTEKMKHRYCQQMTQNHSRSLHFEVKQKLKTVE